MMRGYHVFLLAFIFSLAVQAWIWSVDSFTDQGLWEQRLGYLERDLGDGSFSQKDYSAHPGTIILLLGSGFHQLGFSNAISLKAAVAILVSLALGGVAIVLYELSPTSPWWITGTAMASLSPFFTEASPTNAVVAVWLVFIWYLVILIYQKHEEQNWAWNVFGISLGIAFSAHLGLAMLISFPAVLFLAWRGRSQQMAPTLVIAVGIFIVLDPIVWHLPKEHGLLLFQRIAVHTLELGISHLTLLDLPLFAPLALAAWVVALGMLWRKWVTPLSQHSVMFATASTVAITAVFLYAKTQSVRYFFPLIMFWEATLPLWLWEFGKRLRLRAAVILSMAVMLLAGQALLLIQALY